MLAINIISYSPKHSSLKWKQARAYLIIKFSSGSEKITAKQRDKYWIYFLFWKTSSYMKETTIILTRSSPCKREDEMPGSESFI